MKIAESLVHFILFVTMIIVSTTTFSSCGGEGDKHPNVKSLPLLNSYAEKFRLLRIKSDKGKIKMIVRKNDYELSLNYHNDFYKVFPGKNSWYYRNQYDNTFFDCSMKSKNISIQNICGSDNFRTDPIGTGKMLIHVLACEDSLSFSTSISHVLLVDLDTGKIDKQFDYIGPHFIGDLLHYMHQKGDTLRTLATLPPLFYLIPELYSKNKKEIKLFHKIYPQAQEKILQLIDQYPDNYYNTEGDFVRNFDYNKVYDGLLSHIQNRALAETSIHPNICQRGYPYFMKHSVVLAYYSDWKPDSIVPSLSKFIHLPTPQNPANVKLQQFDHSLAFYSFPHPLKGSSTRLELYYYNISVGKDTLQFKYSQPVYLFESRRLKDGRVTIALSTEEFNSGNSKEASGNLSVDNVFFLLYDPEKKNDPELLSEQEWLEI